MAWKVKQYLCAYQEGPYQVDEAKQVVAFSDVNDAKTKIGLTTAHTSTNGSPTTTYALEDSNKTMVATYSFDTWDNMITWYNSMSSDWYSPAADHSVWYKKVQWLNEDDSVRSETSFAWNNGATFTV